MDTLTPAQKWAPYALSAGKQLGIDPAFVLAQWLYETGGGTNLGSTKYNNLAGIKSAPNAAKGIYDPSDSIHAGYNSLSAFKDDYVRVMNLRYYDNFRSTALPGSSPLVSLAAMNASPWAEADYNTQGFLKYYNQAAGIMGTSSNFSTDGLLDSFSNIDTDAMLEVIKKNWWLIGAALILIAIVK